MVSTDAAPYSLGPLVRRDRQEERIYCPQDVFGLNIWSSNGAVAQCREHAGGKGFIRCRSCHLGCFYSPLLKLLFQ